MLTIQELAKLAGVSERIIRRRLDLGWSVKRAMTQPVQAKSKWNE